MAHIRQLGQFAKINSFWWTGQVPVHNRARELFAVPPAPDAPEKDRGAVKGVQSYMTEKIEQLNACLKEDANVVLVDTHERPAFGTRKPDIVGYVRGKPTSAFWIAVVGEVKDRRRTNDGFVDDEIGRLESMMEGFLAMEGQFRRNVTGFLTDGKSIEFFRLSFEPNRRFLSTPTYSLATEGADALVSLLKASCEMLGLPPRSVMIRGDDQQEGRAVELEHGLGRGTSAVVYAGGIGGEKVVVKCFKEPESMEVESAMLERLRGSAVPRLIGRGDRVLVESPIGHPFAASPQAILESSHLPRPAGLTDEDKPVCATVDDIRQLIDILQEAHARGVVHRDLNFSNMFLDRSNNKARNVLISLFGS